MRSGSTRGPGVLLTSESVTEGGKLQGLLGSTKQQAQCSRFIYKTASPPVFPRKSTDSSLTFAHMPHPMHISSEIFAFLSELCTSIHIFPENGKKRRIGCKEQVRQIHLPFVKIVDPGAPKWAPSCAHSTLQKWIHSFSQKLDFCVKFSKPTCMEWTDGFNSPIRLTGQIFRHSWLHLFGLQRSLFTMAILVILPCAIFSCCAVLSFTVCFGMTSSHCCFNLVSKCCATIAFSVFVLHS